MYGRRREARFRLSPAWEAAVVTLHDVIPERANGDEVWVLGQAPVPQGTELTLEVAGGGRFDVRVLESELVIVDGAMRHRLRLRVLSPEAVDLLGSLPGVEPASGRLGEWKRKRELP